MRPLLLELQGFTCFRQRQCIDIGELDLFAISGPTGSGKSSLLDAICFGLYGQVPRLGRKVRSVVSQGERSARVRLIFVVDKRRFEVTRQTFASGRASLALLDEHDDGETIKRAEGVAGVNDYCAELIGLSADAFMQAVILPQGQFERFLKAKPSDREAILAELLRMSIYSAMGSLARQRAKELAVRIDEGQRRLDADYADATPAALAEAKEKRGVVEETARVTRMKLESAIAMVADVSRLAQTTKNLDDTLAKQRQHDEAEAELTRQGDRLAAHKRALPLRDAMANVDRLTQAVDDVEVAVTEALERQQKTERELEEARRIHDEAVADAATLSELEAELERLSVEKERQARRQEIAAQLSRGRARLERLEATQQQLQRQTVDIDKKRKAIVDRLKQIVAELSEVDHDEATLHALQSAASVRQGMNAALEDTQRRQESLEQLKSKMQSSKKAFEIKYESVAERQTDVDRAKKEEDEASAALDDHRRIQAANALRRHLHEGESCPVCEQAVSAVPAADDDVDDDEKLNARRRAVQKRERALQVHGASVGELEVARRRYDDVKQSVADESEALGNAEAELRRCCARLRDALLSDETEPKVLSERYEKAIESAERQAARSRELLDDKAQTERDGRHTEERYAEANERIAENSTELDEIRDEVASVADTLQALGPSQANILDDHARVQQSIQTIRSRREETRDVLDRATAAFSVDDGKRVAAQERRAALVEESEVAANDLAERRRQNGFASDEDIRAAFLEDEEAMQIEQRLGDHQKEGVALSIRIESLQSELGDRRVSDDDVDRARAEEAALRESERTVGEERDRLNATITRLIDDVDRAVSLRAELTKVRADAAVLQQLGDDLKKDGFMRFLLQRTVYELVTIASARLFELTARYHLAVDDKGGFVVIDQDNAGGRRSVDTLSGGETFLASLSLALALSEHIQRTLGAVRLESLFIDEGFGALDAETLESVIAAIETLSAEQRMIGIITHVERLTRRLPNRIDLTKTGGATTARVVEQS